MENERIRPDKIYMAPMEGITGFVYRRAHFHHFGRLDRYYTPFLTNIGLNRREIEDTLPENNEGMDVVPQILTNHSEVFLELARQMQSLGYREVNLNLGCPSGTVTAKGRGSGFLRFLQELDVFLQEIFENCPVNISVKTRIGYASEMEWPQILAVLDRYPFTELIIHPRLRTDFYRGEAKREAFLYARDHTDKLLCYNGDIRTIEDYERLRNELTEPVCVMLGRGLIANPGLAGELTGCGPMTREQLEGFLDELLAGYAGVMKEERNILCRLLEMWSYLGTCFEGSQKTLKKMRKAGSLREYESLVKEILDSRDWP